MRKLLLGPISFIFSLIIKIRNFLYNSGIKKSQFFNNVNIIAVGNLAVGGTGKTPLTEFLIKNLKKKHSVAVLSRGYKRKSKGFLYVTKTKKSAEVGDEPLQIAQKFENITVAVCRNRIKGIKKISSEKNPDIIILDDAFQHRKVKPKLSILLTDYNNPFYKDYFLPLGKLRDNRKEYLRAEIIVITNCPEQIKPIEKSIWRDNINVQPFQKHFFSRVKYAQTLKNIINKNKQISTEKLEEYNILALSGLANAKYFNNHLEKTKPQKIIKIKYTDHKNYKKKNIEHIIKRFNKIKSDKKIIITTEKDAVKLKEIIPAQYKNFFYYLEIETEIIFNMKNDYLKEILSYIKK